MRTPTEAQTRHFVGLLRRNTSTLQPPQRGPGLLRSSFGWGIILASLLAFPLAGQTPGKISGMGRDAQTGEPLIGANVVLVGTSQGGATHLDGSYFILNVTPGQYDLQASMLGYQRVNLRGIIVNSNRTTTADFSLTSTAIEQEEDRRSVV